MVLCMLLCFYVPICKAFWMKWECKCNHISYDIYLSFLAKQSNLICFGFLTRSTATIACKLLGMIIIDRILFDGKMLCF
jgi:hypothetical protein